jgi:NAD+ kinase
MNKSERRYRPRLLIVYKKSSYQEHVLDEQDANYLRLLRERSIVTRKSKSTHDTHVDALETIKRHLRNLRIRHDVCLRTQLKPIHGYDLVLTIGGDGTFLETSHFLKAGVLLGINSVPKESVGHYCKATAETFLDKLYEFIHGRCRLQTLHRLRVAVDGKVFWPLALNDVLFANTNPAGTTRYVLKVGARQEEQKSSGLWISPAPGSTAATKSAGGRALPLSSTDIQYVVREPYAPRGKRYALLKGVLGKSGTVEILSMMDEAALFIDGPHIVYLLRRASRIAIRNAMEPIRAIW